MVETLQPGMLVMVGGHEICEVVYVGNHVVILAPLSRNPQFITRIAGYTEDVKPIPNH